MYRPLEYLVLDRANTNRPYMLFTLLALLFAYWFYIYVQRRRQYQADTAFGAQHGCQDFSVDYPVKWPLGLDVLKAQYKANADQRLLAYQQPTIDALGPNFMMKLLGTVGFTTMDPKNVEAILSSKFADFGMGSRRGAIFPFIGEGIFTQDGSQWKHSRELLRRPFLKTHYQDLRNFDGPVDKLLASLSSSDGIVDLQPLFFRYTLATTTSLIFGQPIDTFKATERDTFARCFDYASLISSYRVRLQDFYWLYNPSEYRKSCQTVKAFASIFVNQALRDEDKGTSGKGSDRYAFIQDLHDELKDPKLVRDQLVNVLLAGRDTTACLLSWTFFLLVRHPSSLDRLRNEIQSVVGDDVELSRVHIQKMLYLRCILNETLRLYPPIPINVRIAQKTTVIPHGGGPNGTSPVLVRKGTGIGFVAYYMHRRKDLYGDDAMEFRPQRWEKENLANIGYAYLPFHGGPRLCLGQDFALTEASYAIVRIVQAFPNLRLPPDYPVVPTGLEKQNLSIFLSSADGCKVLVH